MIVFIVVIITGEGPQVVVVDVVVVDTARAELWF